MEDALAKLADAGAGLEIETVQLGAAQVKLGFDQGFDEEVLAKIRRSRVLLTAPTVNDVITPLRIALGDDCKIFTPAKLNRSAMLAAALEMLRYLGQDEVVDRIPL